MLTLRPVQWIQLINTFRNNIGIEALSHCGSRGGVRSFPVPLEEPYFPTSSSLQHNFLPNCLFIAYFYPSLFNSHPFVLINYLCLCFYPSSFRWSKWQRFLRKDVGGRSSKCKETTRLIFLNVIKYKYGGNRNTVTIIQYLKPFVCMTAWGLSLV